MKVTAAKLGWTALYLLIEVHAWRHDLSWFRWRILPSLVWLLLLSPGFLKLWGEFVSRLVLTVIYLGALPLGLAVRLFLDPLRTKSRPLTSLWIHREPEDESLPAATRQG